MSPSLILPRSDRERYTDWRRRCLRQAGFARATAEWLARDMTFDLNALLELVDRGCPPDLAVRIVEPLDREEAP